MHVSYFMPVIHRSRCLCCSSSPGAWFAAAPPSPAASGQGQDGHTAPCALPVPDSMYSLPLLSLLTKPSGPGALSLKLTPFSLSSSHGQGAVALLLFVLWLTLH